MSRATGISTNSCTIRPEFFLLVDLREKNSDLGTRGREKKEKKALKMTGHFQSFFFFFFLSELFFFLFNISISLIKNSKTGKVNINSLYQIF